MKDINQPDSLSPEQPHFIAVGDTDDQMLPVPTFVTKDRDEQTRRRFAEILAKTTNVQPKP